MEAVVLFAGEYEKRSGKKILNRETKRLQKRTNIAKQVLHAFVTKVYPE